MDTEGKLGAVLKCALFEQGSDDEEETSIGMAECRLDDYNVPARRALRSKVRCGPAPTGRHAGSTWSIMVFNAGAHMDRVYIVYSSKGVFD